MYHWTVVIVLLIEVQYIQYLLQQHITHFSSRPNARIALLFATPCALLCSAPAVPRSLCSALHQPSHLVSSLLICASVPCFSGSPSDSSSRPWRSRVRRPPVQRRGGQCSCRRRPASARNASGEASRGARFLEANVVNYKEKGTGRDRREQSTRPSLFHCNSITRAVCCRKWSTGASRALWEWRSSFRSTCAKRASRTSRRASTPACKSRSRSRYSNVH